jgi:hypothetical protein
LVGTEGTAVVVALAFVAQAFMVVRLIVRLGMADHLESHLVDHLKSHLIGHPTNHPVSLLIDPYHLACP